jgi:hypothetical protein
MPLQCPVSYAGFATNMATNAEKSAYYPHTMPKHGDEIVAEGKWQQRKNPRTEKPQPPAAGNGEKAVPMQHVVYQNRQARLLVEALENPDHKYRHRALQAVRRFTAAIEKDLAQDLIQDKGILIQEASQLYGIPASTISDWTDIGLITVHYRGRGKQGVFIDKQEIAAAAPIYHDAKQKREQPARRLKAMREQQAEGNSQPSRRTRS